MLSRAAILLYAGLAYLLALANIAYIIGFLQDVLVPKGINDGTPGAFWPSVAINIGLVWLFGLHHSATARRWFKARWTRIVPPALERATYLYMTAVATGLMVFFWQPVPNQIWHVEAPVAVWTIYGLYLAVVGAMFSATFPIGHFGFFALAQAWDQVRGKIAAKPDFTARWLYALVRHPISVGWMLLPWLTPHMTVGQLCFALGTLSYILVATIFEEADLADELGAVYSDYRARVPAFVPRLLRRSRPKRSVPAE